jgi:O-antigen ligase
MIWHSAIRMIRDSPFTGIGPGRFQSVYLEYQRFYPPYLEWAVPHPHNLFLALWLSSGIIGVSASIGLCVFLFRSLREIPRKKERALMTALFLGVFVSGLSDVPYFRAEFCFIFWLELALFSGIFLKENQNSIR